MQALVMAAILASGVATPGSAAPQTAAPESAAPESAAPDSAYGSVMSPYFAELGRQCPDRRLDKLSPADLRDVLDAFKAGLPPDPRSRMDRAETAACADSLAGASCPNVADIRVAGQLGLIRSLASRVCGAFRSCRSQSDCK